MILTAKSYKATPAPRPSTQLIAGDWAIAALLVLNLTIQFIADEQQWTYQNYKRGKDKKAQKLPDSVLKTLESDPDVKRGFVTRGLWAYSRHPNFACEQTTWYVLKRAPL
jgi:steroid 5-alpha reductase family enzyme